MLQRKCWAFAKTQLSTAALVSLPSNVFSPLMIIPFQLSTTSYGDHSSEVSLRLSSSNSLNSPPTDLKGHIVSPTSDFGTQKPSGQELFVNVLNLLVFEEEYDPSAIPNDQITETKNTHEIVLKPALNEGEAPIDDSVIAHSAINSLKPTTETLPISSNDKSIEITKDENFGSISNTAEAKVATAAQPPEPGLSDLPKSDSLTTSANYRRLDFQRTVLSTSNQLEPTQQTTRTHAPPLIIEQAKNVEQDTLYQPDQPNRPNSSQAIGPAETTSSLTRPTTPIHATIEPKIDSPPTNVGKPSIEGSLPVDSQQQQTIKPTASSRPVDSTTTISQEPVVNRTTTRIAAHSNSIRHTETSRGPLEAPPPHMDSFQTPIQQRPNAKSDQGKASFDAASVENTLFDRQKNGAVNEQPVLPSDAKTNKLLSLDTIALPTPTSKIQKVEPETSPKTMPKRVGPAASQDISEAFETGTLEPASVSPTSAIRRTNDSGLPHISQTDSIRNFDSQQLTENISEVAPKNRPIDSTSAPPQFLYLEDVGLSNRNQVSTGNPFREIMLEARLPTIEDAFRNQVVNALKTQVVSTSAGESEIRVKLSPPELGSLKVDIITQPGESTRVSIQTDNLFAQHLLENNIRSLVNSLEFAGIEHLEIDISQSGHQHDRPNSQAYPENDPLSYRRSVPVSDDDMGIQDSNDSRINIIA